jgi:hypothetical protein
MFAIIVLVLIIFLYSMSRRGALALKRALRIVNENGIILPLRL